MSLVVQTARLSLSCGGKGVKMRKIRADVWDKGNRLTQFYEVVEKCEACDGTGDGDDGEECKECGGEGETTKYQ